MPDQALLPAERKSSTSAGSNAGVRGLAPDAAIEANPACSDASVDVKSEDLTPPSAEPGGPWIDSARYAVLASEWPGHSAQ